MNNPFIINKLILLIIYSIKYTINIFLLCSKKSEIVIKIFNIYYYKYL